MQNEIKIIQMDDRYRQRLGWVQHVRFFVVKVNGVMVKSWCDGGQPEDSDGEELDLIIERWIELWEKALQCKATRLELPGRQVLPVLS